MSSQAVKIEKIIGTASREQFLEYSAHGGFNNQRRCLFHALLVAYAVNRTLVVPPALSHRSTQHYGSCPTSVKSPDATRSRFENTVRSVVNFRPSLRQVVSIDGAGVRLMDYAKVFEGSNVLSAAALRYDCTNTIWTFGARSKGCRTTSYGSPRGGCACRSVLETIGTRSEPIVRLGSIFKGVDLASFDQKYGKATRERFLQATLNYSLPFASVAEPATCSVDGTIKNRNFNTSQCGNYAAVHIRGSDGDFRNRVDSSISRALRDVAARAPDARALYVASDISLSVISRRSAFKEGMKRFAGVPSVVSLKQVLKTTPMRAISAAAAALGFDKSEAKKFANTPDLDMHLDILIAANARLAFAGTAGSSMSTAISTLRNFNLGATAQQEIPVRGAPHTSEYKRSHAPPVLPPSKRNASATETPHPPGSVRKGKHQNSTRRLRARPSILYRRN